MRMLAVIIVTLNLIACGSGSNGSGAQNNETTGSEQPDYKTFHLESRDDLKPCNKERSDWLVYLMDEEIFLGCDGKEWAEIDITKEVRTEVTNVPEAETSWQDPVTKKVWHYNGIKASYPYDYSANEDACAVFGHVLPSQGDLNAAIDHGLYVNMAKIYTTGLNTLGYATQNTTNGDLDFRVINVQGGVGGSSGHYINFDGSNNNSYSGFAGVYCHE